MGLFDNLGSGLRIRAGRVISDWESGVIPNLVDCYGKPNVKEDTNTSNAKNGNEYGSQTNVYGQMLKSLNN